MRRILCATILLCTACPGSPAGTVDASMDASLDSGVDAGPPCSIDSDCHNSERCCPSDGQCHPIVGTGDMCDCDHQCAFNEGCFPGVCGDPTFRCVPACYPGRPGDGGVSQPDCPNVNGQRTFCNPLPPSQITEGGPGGACIPGDGCNVTTQNCPHMPTDRSQPASTNNPLIPYNCIQVAPGITGCLPSGPAGVGAACEELCVPPLNAEPLFPNCGVGYSCVQPTDSTGNPIGQAICEKACGDPSDAGTISDECSGNQTCAALALPFGPPPTVSQSAACCVPSGGSCAMNTDCCDQICSGGQCE